MAGFLGWWPWPRPGGDRARVSRGSFAGGGWQYSRVVCEQDPQLQTGQIAAPLGACCATAEEEEEGTGSRPSRELDGDARWRLARRLAMLAVPLLVAALCLDGRRPALLPEGFRPLQRKDQLWCNRTFEPPRDWPWIPNVVGTSVQVKVLTYNLEWWSLFQQRGGLAGSAGKLIAHGAVPQRYDIIGFQECEDPSLVLRDGGLIHEYAVVKGSMALCLAYHSPTWAPLSQGEEFVAEDLQGTYYGRRSAQWARLLHKKSQKVVFLVNHHGPLAVNTGGVCGGRATAMNLLRLVVTHAVRGDAIVLLGDFNADPTSETILELSKYFYKVFTGQAYGGVDHIFSNEQFSQEPKDLGRGGSDHGALSVVIDIAGSALVPATFPGVPLVTTTTTSSSQTSTTTSSRTTTSSTAAATTRVAV